MARSTTAPVEAGESGWRANSALLASARSDSGCDRPRHTLSAKCRAVQTEELLTNFDFEASDHGITSRSTTVSSGIVSS